MYFLNLPVSGILLNLYPSTYLKLTLILGYRMPQPHGCPDDYYSIMKDCWKQEANQRPSFETLKWQLDDFNVAMEGQYDET